MKALINAPICPLMTRPSRQCELGDEALFGMAVEVLEETLPGWYRVRTPYRYEDYAPADCLLFGEHNVQRWLSLPKRVVLKSICDVLSGPAVACFPLVTLTRGALVAPVREPDEKGWVRVELPDGREGYTKSSFLGEYYENPAFDQEDALRSAIVNSALSYLGTHYRWGGKTPMGIDCSGLASMAYLLNGVVIWRDASIKEGFPLHEIPRQRRGSAQQSGPRPSPLPAGPGQGHDCGGQPLLRKTRDALLRVPRFVYRSSQRFSIASSRWMRTARPSSISTVNPIQGGVWEDTSVAIRRPWPGWTVLRPHRVWKPTYSASSATGTAYRARPSSTSFRLWS